MARTSRPTLLGSCEVAQRNGGGFQHSASQVEEQSMSNVPAGYRRLEGSERRPAHGADLLGPADPAETLSVTVRVRRRRDAPPLPDHAHWMATPPLKRKFVSHDEFESTYGAAQEDLDAVTRFASLHGIRVDGTSVAGRTATLSGTVAQMRQAFAVDLGRYQTPGGNYRGRDGFIHIPDELAEIVRAVFGLDNRRVGFRNDTDPPGTAPFAAGGPTLPAQYYNFPQVPPDATGQRIGVVEFQGSGGWQQSDVNSTVGGWLFATVTPSVVDVPAAGNSMTVGNFSSEIMLDICVASAIAPGAQIQVYWGGTDELSGQAWFDVIDRIWHSPKAGDPPAPTVVSISYTLIGGDDFISTSSEVSAALINEISTDLQEMALAGITVLVAAGDGGSLGWNNTTQAGGYPGALGKAHVAYPASDPWVTACGGTATGQTPMSTLGEEWAWNDSTGASGGGISAYFTSLPPWQEGVVSQLSLNGGAIGRGVPDVAGNASQNSGYNVYLGTVSQGPFCGTSAVAPLYAGLVAMINARLGQSIGFLNPTLYAFRDNVCVDINNQLFTAQGALTDNGFDGSPGYPSGPGWDACTGLGRIDGGALLAALQGVFAKNLRFILDRTEFGEAEVSATLTSASPGVIPSAFYVVVDGYSATDLGILASDLYPNPPGVAPVLSTSRSGMNMAATALLAEDVSLPPKTPQRFTWVCSANFDTNLSAFNSPPSLPISVILKAEIQSVSDSATVELVAQADPYELDGPVSWLSTDLRVFQMATGDSLPGLSSITLQNTGDPQTDAPTFIKAVIEGLNGNSAPLNAFDQISTDEQVSEVTLDWDPSAPVYNFGVARVRYQSNVPSSKVRVFFRLYQAATTSTAYEPQTYAAVSNSGASMSGLIPVFGVDGTGNVVAIPCFADKRVAAGSLLNTQTDDKNVLLNGIQPAAGDGVSYAYFGCWLDINQSMTNAVPLSPAPAESANPWKNGSQSVLAAITGKHQCLIAEISDEADPVQDGETPASSDKLAQRNLVVVQSANPGNPASHRIPHTFDIRSTPKLAAGAPVDELMIDWGNTPSGCSARVYLPSVGAAAVLDLAATMYPTHRLRQVDSSTLQCMTGGATWVPVPQGGSNIAALLTVDLPAAVRKGQAFTIVVRQVTSDTGARQLDRRSASAATAERRVLGTFQLTIPVSTEEALLEPEERLLSIMRWIEEGIPANDRWSPVVARYVAQIADRVEGFGGDPGQILPSPTGDGIPKRRHREPKPEKRIVFRGKIAGLVFDRFGDFEGFLLDSEHGERTFHSREREVEELVERAWRDRLRVTVPVDRNEPQRPLSIIIR
jgi:hypothetical protein